MCVQHILHACAATDSSVLCLRLCRREHAGVAHFLCAQVFITYGDKANADLLVSYGFVPDGHNPSDAVSITVGFDPADPLAIQVSALSQAVFFLRASKPGLRSRGQECMLYLL